MGNEEKKSEAGTAEVTTPLRKVTTVLLIVLTVLMLGAAMATCYQRAILSPPVREHYEGRVLDKYLTTHETEEGSSVRNHLLIEGESGEQFQVVVSPAVFQRAQVGMLIRRKGSAIELSADGRDWK